MSSPHDPDENSSNMEWTAEELRMLRSLPRDAVVDSALEQRVLSALRVRGLVGSVGTRHRLILQVAAGLTIFAAGLVCGQFASARHARGAAATAREEPSELRIQQSTRALVEALNDGLGDRTDSSGHGVQSGIVNEVAVRSLHAAVMTVVRLSPTSIGSVCPSTLELTSQASHPLGPTGREAIWY